MRECIGVSVIALWGGSFLAPSGRISLIRELKMCEGGDCAEKQMIDCTRCTNLIVMCNIMLSIGKKNMMNMETRTFIFGTVRRISSIGLGGKANCGIKTMSKVNSLILS